MNFFLPPKSWKKKHPQKLLRIPQIHFFSLLPWQPKQPEQKNSCYKMWPIDQLYIELGTFPKWGTNPICYKGKSPFYRAISLGTILVGMKLPVNPATWLWAMIELRCLWTVWILGQKDPSYLLALHWYIYLLAWPVK